MNSKNRHRRILLLMIVSQLLLTGFVIQWIFSQYNEEKLLLEKELNAYYINSHDEVLDTLLFKTYVVPVLSENRILMMSRRPASSDSVVNKSITYSLSSSGKKGHNLSESTMVTVNFREEKDSLSSGKDQGKEKRLPDDMLLKSVKLIIAHSADSSKIRNAETIDFSSEMDTSKFKKYFYKKVDANRMPFHIRWTTSKPGIKGSKTDHVLRIEPLPGVSLPEASVTGYRGYLAGRITTQILFGLALVFITALAFLLAYRSLRNHMILNNLRNEFVNNITHELKTPVSTIMVALEALGNYNMNKEPQIMEEYLRLASEETKRLGDLINRVLDHTVLEQKDHPLAITRIEPVRLIRDVVDNMQTKLGNRGRIKFITEEDNITINGDELYIKGILINLIDNSIKYCDKDPVITVTAKKKGSDIVIEVRDNGPGIPESYQKKIFEKFFRVPAENVHNVKGYGLGLSFASLVMELHKGSIEVRNLNPGCIFVLKFPGDQ